MQWLDRDIQFGKDVTGVWAMASAMAMILIRSLAGMILVN